MGNKVEEIYKHNKALLHKITKNFHSLSSEELYSCKLIGIWKALKSDCQKYSFNTIMGNLVRWECLRLCSERQNKINIEQTTINNLLDNHSDNFDQIDFLDETELNFLKDRYLYRYTIKEMCQKYNCCDETIRRKTNQIKDIIEDNLILDKKGV